MSDESERRSGDDPPPSSREGFDEPEADGLGDLDGFGDLEGLDGIDGLDADLGEVGATTAAEASTGAARRRLAGVMALLLGAIGTLLAIVFAFLALRLLFGASGTVDDLMDPVTEAFDRLEDRIDQADDLIDRRGIETDDVSELRARVDSLVDVSTSANRSFDTVQDHAIYGLLPADLSGLDVALDRFETSADNIDEALGTAPTVRAAAAAVMADEVDGMQSRVTDARATIDSAASSLRSWLRLGGLLGFLIALWFLWSQLVFARRGWRGVRNQQV